MKKGCVVGFGAVGPVHAEALAKTGRLGGICDNQPERLRRGEKYGVSLYSDFDEMLADTGIDAVHICTPHYLHTPMLAAALEAGKDVVLEKPVSVSVQELDAALEAEKKSDKRVCVMLQNRTNASVVRLRQAAESREFGKIIGINAFVTWHRDREYYESDAWRGKWETEGGGLLINQAIHTLDLISYIGGRIKTVRGSISTKLLGDCIEAEDTADALFIHENGVRTCFYGTNNFPLNPPASLEVHFENAVLRYADKMLIKICSGTAEVIEKDDTAAAGKDYWGSGHERVINSFYSLLETGTGEYIGLNDAEHAMRTLFAFYESARNSGRAANI